MNNLPIILDRFPIDSIEFFVDSFRKEKFQVEFVVLQSTSRYKNEFDFLGIDCTSDVEIIKGRVFSSAEPVLSFSDLETYSKYEGLFVNLISRFLLKNHAFTAEEMSEHYFLLINYWTGVVKNKNIKACFSYYQPHDPSSFALYLVSKLQKIPYIYVDAPLVINKYRFIGCSFSERDLLICASSKVNQAFSEDLQNYIDELRLVKNKYLPVHLRVEARAHKKFIHIIPQLVSKFFESFAQYNSYFKINRNLWFSKKNSFTKLYFWKIRAQNSILLWFKKTFYNLSSLEAPPQGNYIYYPAPLAPEGATLPTALHARNQQYFLQMISKALPPNVAIIYKENPAQFNPGFLSSTLINWKSFNYYKNLRMIPNLITVKSDVPSIDLIRGSIGVAAINGTVAIEAVALGKICITTASNWYDHLDGIIKVNNIEDIEQAIKKMLECQDFQFNLKEPMFNPDVFFPVDEHRINDFSKNDRIKVFKALVAGFTKFGELDERKWRV